MSSVDDVVEWMIERVSKDIFYQSDAVYDIENIFGRDFVYENERGNLAINRKVLDLFRKKTDDWVVWERVGRYWRKREQSDNPGRRQES